MKTLVTDPFADDARSILEWAYGSIAALKFDQNFTVLRQRAGQAFMNTLYDVDNSEFRRLTGSLVDPFYSDKKLPDAIDKLTSKDMVLGVHRAYHTVNNKLTETTPCGCAKGENHWLPDGE